MNGYAFDHISIGVRDGAARLVELRRTLGVTPLAGERLPLFRYVLSRVGDAGEGMQLELIEQQGGDASFMHRFLERHGEGVHHLTFTVPNVERTIEDVESAGFRVVRVDLEHPPWREAFIFPTEPGLGVVIQFADSTKSYPPMSEFIKGPVADPESIPHNSGGRDRRWWHEACEGISVGPTAYLKRVELATEEPERVLALLAGPLGGTARQSRDGFTDLSWGESTLRVVPANESGVRALVYAGGPESDFSIGAAYFVFEPECER